MALIPADVGLRLRLDSEQQLQPVSPLKGSNTDLPNLTKGQVFTAQIRDILPQSTYVALVAGKQVTLELPETVKQGDVLELVVVDKTDKGILAARTQAGSNVNPPQTTFSTAGHMLRALLVQEDDSPQAAALNRGQPLLDKPPQSATELVKALNQAVKESGLFYEAHQAQWVKGKLSLQQLRQEPQGRQPAMPQPGAAPAAHAGSTPGGSVTGLVLAAQPLTAGAQALAPGGGGLGPTAAASAAAPAATPNPAVSQNPLPGVPIAGGTLPAQAQTPSAGSPDLLPQGQGAISSAAAATTGPAASVLASASASVAAQAAAQAAVPAVADQPQPDGVAAPPDQPQAALPRQLGQQLLLYQSNQAPAGQGMQAANAPQPLPSASLAAAPNAAAAQDTLATGMTPAQPSAELAGRPSMPGAEAAAPRLPMPTPGQVMPVIPDELRVLVQQQLDAAGSQRLLWHGEVWPEQQMQWQIERREQGYRNEDDEEISWQTRLRMITPRLGAMDASLQLGLSGVRITLSAHDAQTAAQMRHAGEELENALAAAGVPLRGLQVRVLEAASEEGGA